MEIGDIIPHIEALIFASDKPLTAMELTELANNAFGFMDEKLTLEQIQTAIDGIVEKYRSEFYPFEVRESGGGLQFLTKKEYHKTVAQLNGEKFLKRLSNAALETLSIIAYKQPVTKGEIESIRGVSSDYAIQRLLEKELVVITGRNEKMPGHPLVYATSRSFMDYFGINSAEDLPKLKEVFDEALVNPTQIDNMRQNPDDGQDAEQDTVDNNDNNELLAVTRAGELTTAKIKKDKEDTANGKRSSQNQVSEESLSDDSLSDSGRDNFVEEGLDAGADSGFEESITNDASEQGITVGDDSAGDDSADDASSGDDFAENDIAEDNIVEDETLEEDLVDNDAAEKDLFEEDQSEEEDLSNNESDADVAEEDLVEENLDEENLIVENIAGEEDVVEEDLAEEEDVVEEDVVEEDVAEEEDVVEEDVAEEDPDEDSIERDAVKGAGTSDKSDESDDQESGSDETNDGSDNNADTNKGKSRNQD